MSAPGIDGGWRPAGARLGGRVAARRIGSLSAIGGRTMARTVSARRTPAGRPTALRLTPGRAVVARAPRYAPGPAPAPAGEAGPPPGLSEFAWEWMYGGRLPEDAVPYTGVAAGAAPQRPPDRPSATTTPAPPSP
ncbi:MAG TPA: hypothetical protein PKD59_14035, partial [Miltoncostaeaceae bacterium]|nr:hypothetical protein [Miltoncostaeaceae bacterium]